MFGVPGIGGKFHENHYNHFRDGPDTQNSLLVLICMIYKKSVPNIQLKNLNKISVTFKNL